MEKEEIKKKLLSIYNSRFITKRIGFINKYYIVDSITFVDKYMKHNNIKVIDIENYVNENDLTKQNIYYHKFQPKDKTSYNINLSSQKCKDLTVFRDDGRTYINFYKIEKNIEEIVDHIYDDSKNNKYFYWGRFTFLLNDFGIKDLDLKEENLNEFLFSTTISNIIEESKFDYFELYSKVINDKKVIIRDKNLDLKLLTRTSNTSYKYQKLRFNQLPRDNFNYQYVYSVTLNIEKKDVKPRRKVLNSYHMFYTYFYGLADTIFLINLYCDPKNKIHKNYKFDIENISFDYFRTQKQKRDQLFERQIKIFTNNYNLYKKTKFGKKEISKLKENFNRYINSIEEKSKEYIISRQQVYDTDVQRYKPIFNLFGIKIEERLKLCTSN